MTSEASPLDQMRAKISEGLVAIKVVREALLDVSALLEIQIEDLEFAMRAFEMDRAWARVLPDEKVPQ